MAEMAAQTPSFGISQITTFLGLQTRPDSFGLTIEYLKTELKRAFAILDPTNVDSLITPSNMCLLLQNVIIKKLKSFKKKLAPPDFAKKVEYFSSPQFVEALLTPLPTRYSRVSQGATAASYADWLDTLFSISYENWRDDALAPISNQSQCIEALGLRGEVSQAKVREYQITNDLLCYLCNRNMKSDEHTMECEHILPIVTALSHWWLIKDPPETDLTLKELLRHEYDWSHRCCNQIKSNVDFITLSAGGMYTPALAPIKSVLRLIFNPTTSGLGCEALDKPTNLDRAIDTNKDRIIANKLTPLLTVINNNVRSFDNPGLYDLFTKFKLLSAISSKIFTEALTGITISPTIRVPKREDVEEGNPYAKQYTYKRKRTNSTNQPESINQSGGAEYDLPKVLFDEAISNLTGGEFRDYTEMIDPHILLATYIQFNPAFTDFNELAAEFKYLLDEGLLIRPAIHIKTQTKNLVAPKARGLNYRSNTLKRLTNARRMMQEQFRLQTVPTRAAGGYSKNRKTRKIRKTKRN